MVHSQTTHRRNNVPILIVKDVSHHTIDVFKATPEQVESFNRADMHVAIMGWKVESPRELVETSLTREELCNLHNRHVGLDGAIKPGERSKREIAHLIFDGLPKYAKPYNLTPAKGDYYPPTKDADKQKPGPVSKTVQSKRLSRDEEWTTEPLKLVPQKATGCTAKLIDALKNGATIADLKKIVPNWQESSITSALHTDVRGKAGYGVKKVKVNGEFTYSLVYPEGHTEPLPHIGKK